jgi:hypothetical protein
LKSIPGKIDETTPNLNPAGNLEVKGRRHTDFGRGSARPGIASGGERFGGSAMTGLTGRRRRRARRIKTESGAAEDRGP